MKAQIGRWGNSLAVRLPRYVAEELSLEAAMNIDCRVENGKIVIELLREEGDYSLEELLAMPLDKEGEIDWGKPEGEEIW